MSRRQSHSPPHCPTATGPAAPDPGGPRAPRDATWSIPTTTNADGRQTHVYTETIDRLPGRSILVKLFSNNTARHRLSAGRRDGNSTPPSTGLGVAAEAREARTAVLPRHQSSDDAMLRLHGNPKRLCHGLSRRDLLHVGGLGAFGFALANDLSLRRARAGPSSKGSGFGPARSCIVIYKYGSHAPHETSDPKPEAPAEVQGELGAIPTSVRGVPRDVGSVSSYPKTLPDQATGWAAS